MAYTDNQNKKRVIGVMQLVTGPSSLKLSLSETACKDAGIPLCVRQADLRFRRAVTAKNAKGDVALVFNALVGGRMVMQHCSEDTLASVTELYFKTPGNGTSEEQKKALKGFHITIAKAK